MLTENAYGDSRPSYWPRVREFAVPPSMIATATARRLAGDWAGACAAAGVDVDLNQRFLARTHGRDLAAQVRADLRHLAPDLLRWHLPRIAPDGLLRPGLTISLARYDATGPAGAQPVHLVARTAPAWADAGQRISLALWDGSRADAGARRHPHPHPSRRFRLDLHRHLWDARRTDELRTRSGADRPPGGNCPAPVPELLERVPRGRRCAVVRSAASGGGAGEDHTYGRPSRRSAGLPGVVLPSLRRRPSRVSVVIDTSGSVSDAELGSALLEVAAISRAVGGRRDLVTVLPCDASARIVHPLCRAEGIPLLGGGGTDLRTGFDRALRATPRPDAVVVLTDGQTPWPETRPACRTVVGLFPRRHTARPWGESEGDDAYVPDSPPDWARVVHIGSTSTA